MHKINTDMVTDGIIWLIVWYTLHTYVTVSGKKNCPVASGQQPWFFICIENQRDMFAKMYLD